MNEMAKRQFNIFVEQEYIDILTAYGMLKKLSNKTESFRQAMRLIEKQNDLKEILSHMQKARMAAGIPK